MLARTGFDKYSTIIIFASSFYLGCCGFDTRVTDHRAGAGLTFLLHPHTKACRFFGYNFQTCSNLSKPVQS